MKASVILLAAGAGRRMGRRTPKAFLPLGGTPLFEHALQVFRRMPEIAEIVLVVPSRMPSRRRRGALRRMPGVAAVVPGGARRQDSVWKGLRASDPGADIVLVHDAARPFVTPALVRRVLRAARRHGAAVPVVPVADTLKRVGRAGRVRGTMARDSLRIVQTPQGFRRRLLWDAYRRGFGKRPATDDAQIVERAGFPVHAVEGVSENSKITSSLDLQLAEMVLRMFGGASPSGRRPR